MNSQYPDGKYPCPAPFSQLYVVPRGALDLRFCSYHSPTYVTNQEEFYEKCPDALQNFFLENDELLTRRNAFIEGDYARAGCPRGCFWYQKWKTTGKGFSLKDYFVSDRNSFRLNKLWLSIGPDCNLTCRYCLEPSEYRIDFNSCSPSVMKIAEDFVAGGGQILLTGGEPFLPKFKLLPVLERLAARYSTDMGYFDIHTNGTFLNQSCRNIILNSPVKVIHISMDTLRPELFEYLRRGCNFNTVWENATSLARERDAGGFVSPSIVILCAVMRDTYEHIDETVAKAVEYGFRISLNALFKGYYSPDFCRKQALSSLGLAELERLERKVLSFETTYGMDGPVHYQGFLGQVRDLIQAKHNGCSGEQVALGDGGEARRKYGITGLVLQGRPMAAVEEAIKIGHRIHNRLRYLVVHKT